MNKDEGGILLSIHFNAFQPYAVRISPFTIAVVMILEKPDLTDFAIGYPEPGKGFYNRVQVFNFKRNVLILHDRFRNILDLGDEEMNMFGFNNKRLRIVLSRNDIESEYPFEVILGSIEGADD